MNKTGKVRALALTAGALSIGAMGQAFAQDTTESTEIIVTGTRAAGTSPTQSMSPVDLLGAEALTSQGSSDLTDQITSIAPSINTQRFPIADGTAIIRPVNLRNLPPDETLVLINGSRRHRSALVNLQTEPFGTVNQGAQAVDFAMIPSIAIKRIEVLRDGASAQYGSDAIAGVLNVILRDNTDGVELTGQYGKFYAGDGENYQIGANLGTPFGNDGFLDFAAEYTSSDTTSRGSARPDAAAVAAVVGAENVPFNGLGQRWGDPDVQAYKFFLNTQTNIYGGAATLYGHASFADEQTFSGFFYRTPFGVPGVGPRGTLCSCTGNTPNNTSQAIVDDILAQGLNPADYLTASATSPSGWVSLNPIWTFFPGGYNPTFAAEITDYSGVLGIRGETEFGLQWDFAGRFGGNEIGYVLENSINPSLGRLSPLTFRPGDLQQTESGLNLDFVYPWEVGLTQPMNLAFGLEWRDETYEIKAGDVASFANGPTGLIFGVGSDGFQGDSPDAAGVFSRDSMAGYVDLEADLTDRLTIGLAGRYEDFDDFGDTFNWKVSARWEPIDGFAVRGTVNTGFRAPTPGQVNTLDVTTTADATGQLVPLGTFPVNSPVAVILGAQPLDAEDSTNYTVGLVYAPQRNIQATLDFYQIDVDKRIALLSQSITPGSVEDLALIAAGFPGLGSASFFANAFDTQVRGVELSIVTSFQVGGGDLTLDLKSSWNEQEIQEVLFANVNPELLFDYENQLPSNRTVFTTRYDHDSGVGGFVRLNYYSSWQDLTFGELGDFDGKLLVDLELDATINEAYKIAIGADNVFDEYPDDETNSVLSFLGATRPISSPFGFNGGFWYVRLGANF